MRIGTVDLQDDVLVIAEIGNNHEGDFGRARELVDAAAECGVSAVKFQTFKAEDFVGTGNPRRYEQLKGYELSPAQFEELAGRAREHGLLFISTPLDLGSANHLAGYVDAFKIASGDNTFYPLLSNVAESGKPIIVSTGLSDWDAVGHTIDFVHEHQDRTNDGPGLAILHCVTSYPVPADQANLRAIPGLIDRFGIPVGYSDHTLGWLAAVIAVGLGARIIEKHFTLDKQQSEFRDHQLSADPPEMRDLVLRLKEAQALLGDGRKALQPCEEDLAVAVRRSIVARRPLPAGHRVELADLGWLRPGGGLAPGEEGRVVGKKVRRALDSGEPIRLEDLERTIG